MIIVIFTEDYNTYEISNNEFDNAYKYIVTDDALWIFVEDAQHPAFYHKKATVVIPYFMIANVLYYDEIGKALSDFILDIKELEDDSPFGITVERYRSLVGDLVFAETVIT
jgi:hypothetical protein